MKKRLLIISPYFPTSEKWEKELKKGWDEVEYIPFPDVPSTASMAEIYPIAEELVEKIRQWVGDNPEGSCVRLQGSYSLCRLVYQLIDQRCSSKTAIFRLKPR